MNKLLLSPAADAPYSVFVVDGPTSNLPDKVHPNADGYAKIGAVWLQSLWSYLTAPKPVIAPADVEIEPTARSRGQRPTEHHAISGIESEFEFSDWQVVCLLLLAVAALGAAAGLAVYSAVCGSESGSDTQHLTNQQVMTEP